MPPDAPLRPRWLFRGGPGAWDALTAAIATDPQRPARWPIAPSGPSMADGDAVLLWRSGRQGGIAALCTVVGEPEAELHEGRPEVVVGLRIERAFGRPIPPATLVRDPVLRPLAFMDLLETTEHRVTPQQEEALAALIAERAEIDPAGDPAVDLDATDPGERRMLAVPAGLVPLVEELLRSLGADDPGPTSATGARPPWPARSPEDGLVGDGPPDHGPPDHGPLEDRTPSTPTDLQVGHAQEVERRHGDGPFTVDEAAAAWRTGVGTARSRIERLVESGLLVRAGTLRPEERPGVRPTRGRPPVLYRLAAADEVAAPGDVRTVVADAPAPGR